MPSLPLRRLLHLDFLGALLTALALVAFASWLTPHVGLSMFALRVAGLALLPFVAFVLFAARTGAVSPGALVAIIALNTAWIALSVALLALASTSPIGRAIIVAQALPALPLVALELRALASLRSPQTS